MSEQKEASQAERLAEKFDPKEVKWKPQTVRQNRALAIAYIDARVVMDRLDEVLGVTGWQDSYQYLPDGSVACRLTCTVDGATVTKEDVGSPSEQPDGGDRMKAAVSDALKRAAVKFGVGRFLYELPHQWVDYDPVKKQFVKTPLLPKAFLPPLEAGKQNMNRTLTQAAPDGPVRDDQKARIDELASAAGWTTEQFRRAVKYHTHKDDLNNLTASEAAGLIERMEAALQPA